MNKKKGFTLVELLAVLLILALILLLGIKALLPIVTNAKKDIIAKEGILLIESAKNAHESESNDDSTLKIGPTDSYCFSLDWLRKNNYYTKDDNNYRGSVLVLYNESDDSFEYYYWIANDEFYILDAKSNDYEVVQGTTPDDIDTCGGLDPSSFGSGTKYTVSVDCTNCTLDSNQKEIVEGKTAYFFVRANEGYNVDNPDVIGNCEFSSGRLIVRNVRENTACSVIASVGESQGGGSTVIDDEEANYPTGRCAAKYPSSLNSAMFLDKDNLVNKLRNFYTVVSPLEADTYTSSINEMSSTNRTEDGSTVYYFTGSMPNNWVIFGNDGNGTYYYWRIIRTNSAEEGGGVRLLYSGSGKYSTIIPTRIYDAYVGMYTLDSFSYFGSNRRYMIDEWYETSNLINFENYINKDAVYCNDRSLAPGESTSNSEYDFMATTRGSNPAHICGISGDGQYNDTEAAILSYKYSATTNGGGNGQLIHPIAMMTYDEVRFAQSGSCTYDFYCTTCNNPWFYFNGNGESITELYDWETMTPREYYLRYYETGPRDWRGTYGLDGVYGTLTGTRWGDEYVIRPVISLKADVQATGNGTLNYPYVIDTSN